MTDAIISKLQCPICKSELFREGQSLFCRGERRHCYDISKKGYVNLLPPGKMSNAKTGDDSGMIAARRDFLEKGYYDLLSETAAEAVLKVSGEISSFIDAGCGEGHHTLNIAGITKAFAIGFDASKHGANSAAALSRQKGYDNTFFAAANIFDMPVKGSSQNAVFSMFAPVPEAEADRVLTDGGVILVCSSGTRHLWQMREALYGTPRIYEPLSKIPEGFEPVYKTSVRYEITIDHTDIENLFKMTPFYYRSPREGREKLLSLDTLTTEVSAEYNVYKKSKI